MDDLDKLRVMLPHWIDHNRGHGREYAEWARHMGTCGQEEIAELLSRAEKSLQEADAVLQEALRKAGGPSSEGHEHHHHHHNLPE
jgi:hypothetical protein